MSYYDTNTLALILSIQAEIEGMKAINSQQPNDQPYGEIHFYEKANELKAIAYMKNDNGIPSRKDSDIIEDGFGGAWSEWCPSCNKKSMYVCRPGKAQCGNCG